MEHPNIYVTKTEMARRHIQGMVLSGTVRPGDRITSREVSTALGISETPIREAIRSLESEGWLEVQKSCRRRRKRAPCGPDTRDQRIAR